MFFTALQVALGGAIGAVLRFGVVQASARLVPGFPWGTLAVNVLGSALMGLGAALLLSGAGARFAPFALAGVLGGFTTFSAFSLDALKLWEAGAGPAAAAYVAASVGLSLGAAVLGLWIGRGMLA